MDQLASSPPPKRFFDVMPPGHTVPNTTSRPVIVGNKPAQPDPMMAPSTKAVLAPAKPTTPSDAPTPELARPATTIPVAQETPQPEPVASTEQSAAEEAPQSALPAAELAKPTLSEPTKSPESGPAADKPLQPSEPEATEPSDPPPLAKQPAGTTVVVHHQSSGIRLARLALIILAVLLLIAAIDVILDAGVIKTTLPHTHFFTT